MTEPTLYTAESVTHPNSERAQRLDLKIPHIYFCKYYDRYLFSPGWTNNWSKDTRNNTRASHFCTYLNNQRKSK